MITGYLGPLDSDPTLVIEKSEKWIHGSYTLLPNFIVAITLFGIFFLIAKAVEASFVKGRRGASARIRARSSADFCDGRS